MASLLPLLAQQAPAPARSISTWGWNDSVRLLTFIGILIGFLVVGGIVLLHLRRKMSHKDSGLAGAGSLLEELRRLRSSGVMTQDEYDASRKAAAAKLAPRPGESARPQR